MGKDLSKIEHFIFVCNGKDCKKKNAKGLGKALQFELKHQGFRDDAHLVKTKCIGFCKQAPTLILNGECFTKVKINNCQDLIEANIKKKRAD